MLDTIYAAVRETGASNLPLDGGGSPRSGGRGCSPVEERTPHPGADAPTLPIKGGG